MRQKPHWFYKQSGVIPFMRRRGKTKVLVITTQKGLRWIFPKGIIEPGMTARASAEKEAYEEAGAVGEVWEKSLGVYTYTKWGGICTVEVFAMEVRELIEAWPEADTRKRKFIDIEETSEVIMEANVQKMLRHLMKKLQKPV